MRLNTFTLFKSPKKISEFCPQSEQELNNAFLPFDGTARDVDGNNLLLWGVQHNLPTYALQYLLSCGISWNERNNNGETALHKAIDKNPHSIPFILKNTVEECTIEDIQPFGFTTQKTTYKEWLENALEEHIHLVHQQYITVETVNAQDKHQCTALHKACGKGYAEAVELLLEAGADPEIKNDQKKTCIEILCNQPWNQESTNIAVSIFKHYPKLQKTYPEIYTIIAELLTEKYNLQQTTIQIQEHLIKDLNKKLSIQKPQEKISKNIHVDFKKTKPLQLTQSQQKSELNKKVECTYLSKPTKEAVIFKKLRNYQTLKVFLDKKKNKNTDLNSKNIHGFTPLKIVICKGDIPSATLLLEHGADPNAPSHLHLQKEMSQTTHCIWITPLEACTMLSNPGQIFEFIQLLTRYNADFGKAHHLLPLTSMVYNENIDGVAFILKQKNTDINALDFFKNRPLISACDKKNLPLIELLLQHKADPNLLSDNRYPLDSAYEQKAYTMLSRLILNGATKSTVSFVVNGEKLI